MSKDFDAILMIGYGAPEKLEDIMPFLKNVSKGRPIPEERLKEVAHHYELFDGKSPLNEYTYKHMTFYYASQKLLSFFFPN